MRDLSGIGSWMSRGSRRKLIVETRRRAEFITPIPKPKKRKKAAAQEALVFDEAKGLSTKDQQYDPTSIINEVRGQVGAWRALPNPSQWRVSPETARLLQHWRHHDFSGIRTFFCQIEAAETAIWLIEVAPQSTKGNRLLRNLELPNQDANPELPAVGPETCDWRWQDDGDGDAYRLADGQLSAPPNEQTIHARLSGLRTRLDNQGPVAPREGSHLIR